MVRTSEMDSSKKIVVTGAYAINSEYIFRKGSDPMAGMKMYAIVIIH
jgi:Cu(I)/Ag(I) efflux system membrane fusion protein